MMRLSTLWAVDQTVDADGRSSVAERILERWPHDRGSARFFRSSANFVYSVEQAGRRCFLRFAAESERTRNAIEAEVRLVDWLAVAGVTVARPLPSHDGILCETVATDLGRFHAVLFAGLEGEHRDIEDLDEAGFQRWGAALGGLHAALAAYPDAALAPRPTWRDHLAFVDATIPADRVAVRAELAEVASALGSLPAPRDAWGPIHFDFELDNLVWRAGGIGVLDFDDCARSWYAADIAFALRDLFADGFDPDDASYLAFVRGYAAHHRPDERLMGEIPTFLRWIDLLVYTRIVSALDLPASSMHPEWLTGLNRRLRRRMSAYEAGLKAPDS